MKNNKVKLYARALADIASGPASAHEALARQEKIAKNFLALLEKDGQMKKAKEIVAMAEGLFIKKTGRRKIVLETARKVDKKPILNALLDAGDVVEEKTNKDLIAGIKIIINDRQLDLSLQKKLNTIFK